ncbi:hypothetical protein [uncultured Chloroflexus sp.]|uniref:TPR end-of-group domain-containing protein n=1 Tax=uncultured Chloroflexus sp. TaxID=214040 RepID=UPI00261F30D5|nr:hypothetical protein [uncultured Chloroflexus sp.]
MTEPALRGLRAQVFARYNQHSCAAAPTLIDQRMSLFRQYESDLFFRRACLAGCTGDRTSVIGWLQQAADRGLWYHERMLRDSDLDIVRGTEVFAKLQVLFQQRYAQAQAVATPQRRV